MPTAPALVVVPTYDEAENIGPLLDRVLGADERVHVLVVDDGSPDGTADVVARRPEIGGRVHLLRRTTKDGLGAAYRAGFAWGRDRGYEVLVEMDADLSHPPERLPALLDAVSPQGGADLAIGSRYVPGGGTSNWPWYRQAVSRGGNTYVRLVLGLDVADATAGFRAYRRELLDRVGVDTVTSNGYCFQVEMVLRAVRAGARVQEVPITFVERVRGTSKMSTGIVAEALLRVTGWALRGRRAGG